MALNNKLQLVASVILILTLGLHLSEYTYNNVFQPHFGLSQTTKLPVPRSAPPQITFYVRTSASSKLLFRFYCLMLRTAIFNWPPSTGRFLLVLDEQEANDKKFAKLFARQFAKHVPKWPLEIRFESIPKPNYIVNKTVRNPGYRLQLWNSFFLDQFTKDSIIAYMDTDSQMRMPLTREYLVKNETKLWVIGIQKQLPTQRFKFMNDWVTSTEKALGLKSVACFMTTFPQMMWRDTIKNTREYIMRRFKTKEFGIALNKIWRDHSQMSPINIIMNYAWYFERNRYDWHINMPASQKDLINRELPKKYRIMLPYERPTLVGASHGKRFLPYLTVHSYCETMRAVGKPVKACANITHDMETLCEMLVIMPSMRARWQNSIHAWCKNGTLHGCCLEAKQAHYRVVAKIPPSVHEFSRHKIDIVTTMAKEAGVTCPVFKLP